MHTYYALHVPSVLTLLIHLYYYGTGILSRKRQDINKRLTFVKNNAILNSIKTQQGGFSMATIWEYAAGNISGTIYFLYFQLTGFLLSCILLSKKDFITRILCGSVLGSVLLQWCPAVFAFAFQFSIKAHLAAALFCGLVTAVLFFIKKPVKNLFLISKGRLKTLAKRHWLFLLLCGLTFILFCIMLFSHTLLPGEDGLHTGQCTYGDINLHLSIITSLARQQTFPPYYSISPDNK